MISFLKDLVFSKEFGKGLLIGGSIMAVAVVVSYLLNGHV
jgi:hypothetical protein